MDSFTVILVLGYIMYCVFCLCVMHIYKYVGIVYVPVHIHTEVKGKSGVFLYCPPLFKDSVSNQNDLELAVSAGLLAGH